jgi:hypothetical protein
MPTSHKLFLGVSLAVILTLFVVASRPPNEADIEYRPPAPALEHQAARPAGAGLEDDPAGAAQPAADRAGPATAHAPIRSANAARP